MLGTEFDLKQLTKKNGPKVMRTARYHSLKETLRAFDL